MASSQNTDYMAKAQYALAAQQNAYAGATDSISEAENILQHLRDLRSKMHEIVGSFRIANDKIVGPAPEKMPPSNGGAGQIAPNPQGFLHSSSQIISDIDAAASDIGEQLSRLHRSF